MAEVQSRALTVYEKACILAARHCLHGRRQLRPGQLACQALLRSICT